MTDASEVAALSGSHTCPQCGGWKGGWFARVCSQCYTPHGGARGRYGPLAPNWRGGRSYLDDEGYVRTPVGDHPWPRKTAYLMEHVRVMELHLGRRMLASEVVHHRDGNKQNNDISNLEVMDNVAHSRMHRMRKVGRQTAEPSP